MERRTTGGPPPSFHEGEIAVQHRSGVRAEARHLARMLEPPELTGGVVGYLAEQAFLVLTARDNGGVLWTSPLVGPKGFLEVTAPSHLRIAATPSPRDPLHGLPPGQEIGMVTTEFARRRRFRLNGHLTAAGRSGLSVQVAQAYSNCPQYIQRRALQVTDTAPRDSAADPDVGRMSNRLSEGDIEQVRAADTFFLGTTHPSRGSDASHRGGPPGFVRLEDDQTLWWPDYPGNNMFNSLGNLAVDSAAALLFVDFTTGHTLHLTGRAVLHATAPGISGDDGHTGRRVRFHLDVATVGAPLPLRVVRSTASSRNPPLTA
ncbi:MULTISPECIES: pyridoxamine 5'-phosphate oxidase family protein [Nocardioides]|uniref:Pyridoxamine 5'-phosphate oxidase family protein n=1 Tax=Nocardioides vastitatis TaxID=2568655 RepID=A0ABW0ZKY1_9ACTN|nr:pyridoxamine 5'-phosphate oxidase family protein [Nocardioides sp.]THJ08324.1 pyridoxamine 5'-phosphate oxidase [Nocardioides sp.]